MMCAAPVAPHVLQNRHEPGAAVRAGLKPVKRLKRLDHRFLYEVFCFRAIPLEPQGQTEQSVDVRQGFRLKGGPHVIVGGRRWLLCHHSPVRTVYAVIMSRAR